jgi:hypothetical protein
LRGFGGNFALNFERCGMTAHDALLIDLSRCQERRISECSALGQLGNLTFSKIAPTLRVSIE